MKPHLFLRLAVSASFALCNLAISQTIEVTSTGVGIGTATPAAKLDVVGGSVRSDGGIISRSSSTSGLFVGYGQGLDGSSLQVFSLYADTTNGLYFDAPKDASGNKLDVQFNWRGGGTPGLMIKGSSGNVGIRTNNPTYPLEVAGAIYSNTATGGAVVINGGNSNSTPVLYLARGGAGVWGVGLTSDATPSFYINNGVGGGNVMMMTPAGNVGIGTSSPGYKLEVSGSVRASSFIANSNTYADFVFKPGYRLASLSEVEAAIKTDGHLPGIPSEAEAKARGIDLAQMQVKLLQKVEEMTLYLVDHDKELKILRAENAALREQLSQQAKP